MTGVIDEPDTATAVLTTLRDSRHTELAAQAHQVAVAVQWAAMHPAESIIDAARFGDSPVPVAGPGAPLVAEFCVAEFAAALGLPTETGKHLLGEAVELAHRLPRLYARVRELSLPAWRARRIARATISLSLEAAGYVDRHLAPVAHKVGATLVDRLIQEAVARFMPQEAQAAAEAAWDRRHFTVDHQQVSLTGTSRVSGELDVSDALDLEAAIAAGAAQRQALGSTACLDARRAEALGDLARGDVALDVGTTETVARRPVVLTVHLSHDALTGTTTGVGRLDNTRTPITIEQIRAWCGNPYADITVKPVLDLADHVHVTQYEVPDRIAEHVPQRDQTCAFPWCPRPATRCDTDHVIAYAAGGGPTCTENTAPLCRRHHRLKTHHGGWTYTVLEPGSYLWTSPHGYQFLRDHTGTTDVTRDRRRPPDP